MKPTIRIHNAGVHNGIPQYTLRVIFNENGITRIKSHRDTNLEVFKKILSEWNKTNYTYDTCPWDYKNTVILSEKGELVELHPGCLASYKYRFDEYVGRSVPYNLCSYYDKGRKRYVLRCTYHGKKYNLARRREKEEIKQLQNMTKQIIQHDKFKQILEYKEHYKTTYSEAIQKIYNGGMRK